MIRVLGRRRVGSVGTADTPPAPLDDAALVDLSRTDAEAFGQLYDRYYDEIYRYVFRRVGVKEVAQDVAADVFVKALRAIDSYRSEIASFGAWLQRIATNAVIDHLRARRATVSLDAAVDPADPAAAVDEQVVERVEVERVWAAIEALGDAQRTAMTLRYGTDQPIAAIAEQMGRSEGAVKLLLNRGVTAVRDMLRAADDGRESRP